MSKLRKNNELTSFQVFVLVVLPSFTSLSHVVIGRLTKTANADLWISIIITGFLAAFAVLIMVSLARKFPDDSLFIFSKKILGNFFGTIINLVYILYSMIFIALVLRINITIIYNSGLRETPMIFVILLYLLTVVYINTKKVIVINRFAELLFFALIFLIVIIPLLKLEINPDFLLPIGSNGLGKILEAILPAQNIFLGIYFLLFFFPYIGNKQASLKNALVGVGFATLISTFFYILVVGFFGAQRASMFFWPLLKYISTISTPVFERIDILDMWLGPLISLATIFVGFYIAKIGCIEMFSVKRDKKNYLIIIIIFIIITLLTQYPKNYYDLLNFNNMLVVFSIGVNFVIPIILFIFSTIFQRGEI